jgi:hypothetical protein
MRQLHVPRAAEAPPIRGAPPLQSLPRLLSQHGRRRAHKR